MRVFVKGDDFFWVCDEDERSKQIVQFLRDRGEDITDIWESGPDVFSLSVALPIFDHVIESVSKVERGESLWFSYARDTLQYEDFT